MIALRTKSNNFLVSSVDETKNEWWYDIHPSQFGYFNKDEEFVRFASYGEFEWLYSLLTGANPQQDCWIVEHENLIKGKYFEFPYAGFEIEEIFRHTVHEDYSNYDENRCNNGGCYGFWTDLHVVKVFIGKSVYVGSYYTEHTTADFDHCNTCGQFSSHGECAMRLRIPEWAQDDFYRQLGNKIECDYLYSRETFPGCEKQLEIDYKIK